MRSRRIPLLSFALIGLGLSACAAAAEPLSISDSGYQAEHIAAPAAFPSDVEAGAPRDARVDTSVNYEAIPMSVRAKFYVHSKSLSKYTRTDQTQVDAALVTFKAVHAKTVDQAGKFVSYEQTCEENKLFGQFTPSGELTMFIVNPCAHEQLEVGAEYFLDISPAPETAHRADRSDKASA